MKTLAAVLMMALAAAGQDPADPIPGWIEDLASEDIERRDRASSELLKAGEKALPALKKAAAETADAETSARARELVSRIQADIRRKSIQGGKESGGFEVRFVHDSKSLQPDDGFDGDLASNVLKLTVK